jgi:hypothetical protein
MIDRRPRLIARCADMSDVITALRFGREHGLLVAVRGGGHNAGGLGSCDDGLVIDLSPMRFTRVDPAARTVLVGGGATWGDVDHATHGFGMATPSGGLRLEQSRPQYRPDAGEPALRRKNPRRRIVPLAGGARQKALPHARRCAGIRRSKGKPERAPARPVHWGSDR